MMRVITAKDVPELVSTNYENPYIVSLELQDKVKVVDTKTGDYVIEKQVVETEKLNTFDYIQSFKDDVGIENILKKFALTEDPELLNQVKRASAPIMDDGKEAVQDYTNLPSSEEEAIRMAVAAKAAFADLPADLVKNRSFAEFAENFTQDELIAYIKTLNTKEANKDE